MDTGCGVGSATGLERTSEQIIIPIYDNTRGYNLTLDATGLEMLNPYSFSYQIYFPSTRTYTISPPTITYIDQWGDISKLS